MASRDPRVDRPEGAGVPVMVTLTWDDAEYLSHTEFPMSNFDGDFDQYGRYVCIESLNGNDDDLADRLLTSPAFQNGSLLWAESYLEALMLAKIHRAYGYEAHLMSDESGFGAREGSGSWVVLTTWNCMPGDPK